MQSLWYYVVLTGMYIWKKKKGNSILPQRTKEAGLTETD